MAGETVKVRREVPIFPLEWDGFVLPESPPSTCEKTDRYCDAVQNAFLLDTGRSGLLSLRDLTDWITTTHEATMMSNNQAAPAILTPALRDILRRSLEKAYQDGTIQLLLNTENMDALEKNYGGYVFAELLPVGFLPALYNATRDEYLKEAAMRGILKEPKLELIPFLRKVAEEGTSEALREGAVEALMYLEDPWLIRHFEKRLGEVKLAVAVGLIAYKNPRAFEVLKKATQSSDLAMKKAGYQGLIMTRDRRVIPMLLPIAFAEDLSELGQFGLEEFLDLRLVTPEQIAKEIYPTLKSDRPVEMRLRAALFILGHRMLNDKNRGEVAEAIDEGLKREDGPLFVSLLEWLHEYPVEGPVMVSTILRQARRVYEGELETGTFRAHIASDLYPILARHYQESPEVRRFFEEAYAEGWDLDRLLVSWKPFLSSEAWTERVVNLATRPDPHPREPGGMLDWEFIVIAGNYPQAEFLLPATQVAARWTDSEEEDIATSREFFEQLFAAHPPAIGPEWTARLEKEMGQLIPNRDNQDDATRDRRYRQGNRIEDILFMLSYSKDPAVVARVAAHLLKLDQARAISMMNERIFARLVQIDPKPFMEIFPRIKDRGLVSHLLTTLFAYAYGRKEPEFVEFFRRVGKGHSDGDIRERAKRDGYLLGDTEGLERYQREDPSFYFTTLAVQGRTATIDRSHEIDLDIESIHQVIDPETGVPLTGRGVTAIIVDEEFTDSNPELRGRMAVLQGREIVSTPMKVYIPPVYVSYGRGIEHGTAVASVFAGENIGVAPGATVIGVAHPLTKITFYNAINFYTDLFEWAVRQRGKDPTLKFIGISIGSFPALSNHDREIFSRSPWGKRFQSALKRLKDSGVTLVMSAGNSNVAEKAGAGNLSFVSLFGDDVILVGATDTRKTPETFDDEVADFSSRGGRNASLDVVAPGVSILASHRDAEYDFVPGTSFSQPFALGLMAIMAQVNPGLTPGDMDQILKRTADPLAGFGPRDQGAGQINPKKAVALAAFYASPEKGRRIAAALKIDPNSLPLGVSHRP